MPATRARLGVIFFTVFIDLVGFGIVLPILPYYAQSFGARGLLFGALVGAYSGMQFLATAVLGRLEAQVRDRGLQHLVEVRGRVAEQELRRAYAAASVLVLPAIVDARGDTEGLGVVLLEAMSYGVPVIGSDLGGITDIVVDGQTGLLVPPQDSAALAAALERLATDRDLAKRLGEAGAGPVRRALTWPALIAPWGGCDLPGPFPPPPAA